MTADVVVANADWGHTQRELLRRRRACRAPATGAASGVLFLLAVRGAVRGPHHSSSSRGTSGATSTTSSSIGAFPPDPSIYVSRPTATDPSLAPAGVELVYVLVPTPTLESGVDWHAELPAFRERAFARLARAGFADLSGRIVAETTLTPETFGRRYNLSHGSAFGLAATFCSRARSGRRSAPAATRASITSARVPSRRWRADRDDRGTDGRRGDRAGPRDPTDARVPAGGGRRRRARMVRLTPPRSGAAGDRGARAWRGRGDAAGAQPPGPGEPSPRARRPARPGRHHRVWDTRARRRAHRLGAPPRARADLARRVPRHGRARATAGDDPRARADGRHPLDLPADHPHRRAPAHARRLLALARLGRSHERPLRRRPHTLLRGGRPTARAACAWSRRGRRATRRSRASSRSSSGSCDRARGRAPPPSPSSLVTAPAAADGGAIYRARCAVCHGVEGRGDGPAAGLLTPRPRDFTTGRYKFRSTPTGSLPTLADVVVTTARGLRGTSMPAFADVLTPDEHRRLARLRPRLRAGPRCDAPHRVPLPASRRSPPR